MSRRVAMFFVLAFFVMLPVMSHAREWRQEAAGPSFADMVKQSPNVIFAQITATNANTVEAAVTKAMKGRVHDKVIITGFKKNPYIDIKDPRKLFNPGEDAFFFLEGAMVGSMPFDLVKQSVIVRVKGTSVYTSVITPTLDKYKHEMPFELFREYLTNLVAHSRGEAINPAFFGKLVLSLEEAAKNKSDLAATYLTMVLQFKPDYDNSDILFAMLDSGDINARVLAMQTLSELAAREQARLDAEEKESKGKKGKAHKRAAKRGAKKEQSLSEKVYASLVSILKTSKIPMEQSIACMALATVHNPDAIDVLADEIGNLGLETPEPIEVQPAMGAIEAPKKAAIRAIVEFEEDRALDVLEGELRKNEVHSFRLILDIFRDYADSSLNLLLLDLLQDRNFLPRQVAILEYFRRIKDENTIKNLESLFLSPEVGSEYIRKSIIEVFEDYRDPKNTVPFLIEYGLHDPSPVVRQAAARALGELGDPRMVDEIRKIYFKESNRLAREFYVEALSKIKSRSAHETLTWLKEKETDGHMLQQINFALKKSKYLSQ